jgi:hypothetical protein
VEFPASLFITGDYTFAECSELKTVDFSACSGLRNIGSYIFNKCAKLEEVNFPPQLKAIGNYAFQECAALATVDLSGTQLENIGNYAFYKCIGLASIKLPATLKTIGNNAFGTSNNSANPSTTILEIPDFSTLPALTSIGNYAFSYCFPEAELDPVYETLDLSSTAVTSIGENTFRACTRVNKVILPATLTSIGTNAFGNAAPENACTNLETVDFSRCAVLASIGDSAFANTALKQADLSQTALTTLTMNAFKNCTQLKTVKFSVFMASGPTIGANAFNGCSALEACLLYSLPPTAPNVNAFQDVYAEFKMYVPADYLLLYQLLWASFKDKILPLSEYIEIEDFEEGESY